MTPDVTLCAKKFFKPTPFNRTRQAVSAISEQKVSGHLAGRQETSTTRVREIQKHHRRQGGNMESMGRISKAVTVLVLSLVTGLALSLAYGLFTAEAANAAETAVSTDAAGALGVETAVYKFKPSVDPDILPHKATEIWARVYWPRQLKDPKGKKRPLVLFLHGNHGTCGTGSAPRNDSSCQYTNEGACPSGYVVTPNHEGYKYAAEHLASWGYVVASINANRGITCGGGDSDDWGLILARGRLILKHLELWQKWSTQGGAPAEFGNADLFKDVVDIGQVGLMGHSRGGEGIRAALNIFHDKGSIWPAKIPGLDIRALFEIGAVDGQSDRVLDAPSVAWNQLLPLCDGDVSDLQGRNPFERMSAKYFQQNEAEERPSSKSLQMVWGANHNFFNTEWQTSDAWGCAGEPTHKPLFSESKTESPEQKSIAMQSMTGFFRAHVGAEADPTQAQLFDPAFQLPNALTKQGMVDREFIPSLELRKARRADDFTSPTGKNANGPENLATGVNVSHNTFAEPPVARVTWKQPGDDRFFQLNFAETGRSWNVEDFDYLDFRVGRVLNDAERELNEPVSFSLALVDQNEKLSAVLSLDAYTRLLGPPNDSAELTQTVRIPLKDFATDLSQVRAVRFIFNQTPKAEIRLAQVRFGISTAKALTVAVANAPSFFGSLATTVSGWIDSLLPETTVEKVRPGHLRISRNLSARAIGLIGDEEEHKPASVTSATWLRHQPVTKSLQLKGEAGVEMVVRTPGGFPVLNEVPALRIGDELFPVSRYTSSGHTHTLIFSVPQTSYDELPSGALARVQYGTTKPQRVWELPPLTK